MTASIPRDGLFSRGMLAVLFAQFLSAFGDNALLFAAIAELRVAHSPEWMNPLLQEFFVLSFILLAPFVGPFADTWPKGRVMLLANTIKFLGAAVMASGLHPLLCYGFVGIGAAAYSPAKYGILSELVGPEKLVKANSMIEGSTIVAILLGTVSGGWLADQSATLAIASAAAIYLLAALFNLLIPRLPPAHPLPHFSPHDLVRDFLASLRTLLNDRDARFSIAGNSLFWGSGSTLRFLLVAWVPVALGITDNSTPADLNGAVAIGIAVGAALAAKTITLNTVNRSLLAGVMMGILVMVLAHLHTLSASVVVLVLLGTSSGMFVVPLNALLQERGHETVGAGHAIAMQHFCENLSMLAMVGLYTLAARAGAQPIPTAFGFGIFILLGMTLLAAWRLSSQRRKTSTAI